MRFFRHKLVRLIIFLVSLLLVVTLPGSAYTLWRRQDIVALRQHQREELKAKNEALARDLAQAQTPGYIEKVAREKLGLVREGETIVLLNKSHPPAGGPNDQAIEKNQEQIPNWKKWWRLFF